MKYIYVLLMLMFITSMQGQGLSDKVLEGFTFRNVGPAGMSGRITAIDVVTSEPEHIYVGSASGGVWESKDGGITWKPIFDDQPALSIGAIKINQQNPSEIWVGTGEGNPRNSHNSGKGIFRTLDGGRTWSRMGLENSKQIHRILIDYHQPSTIYAGVSGNTWMPGGERGVYKSTDNGKTWNRILYTNEKSGVGDLLMDPVNPRKIVAAMYEHLRTPWDFVSGGPGSGLYITYDAGENWKKITSEEGLPKGDLGRIGLAIAASSPDILYALVEAKENGLYKSTDGGEKWSLVTTKNIGNRPFYYNEIYVDPKNENRIWNLYSYVSKSEDGGRTFETILDYGKSVHPDHHAFYIHPEDTDFIIDGNDGGLNISRDGGRNWYFCENIPVGQFYHLGIDNEYPYNLYGGMQDNGSWVGPAYTLKAGGIRNGDWRELYFGDGFDVVPKLSDTRYGWAMSQGGNLAYYDRETGFNQFVKPVHPEGIRLRYNWNAAIAAIPKTECGIYYGSQFLHKSLDCGQSWTIISPDLTTNDTTKQKQSKSGGLTIDDTEAENHTTILSIAPSAVNTNVIWVGTDDGNVQLTQDGGKTWKNFAGKIPGMPAGAWIPQIEVSKRNAGEAFVVVNHYRRGDWGAYVFHTADFGATWRKITNDKEVTSYVMTIVQDSVETDLLFLGADDGLYVSIDAGNHWSRFPAKVFPRVATSDLKIHPTDHSLAIATFGRALYVLDNLLTLREIARSKQILEKPFVFFPAPDVFQTVNRSVDGIRFTADAEFRGQNRSNAPRFFVYVKPAAKKETTAGETKSKDDKKKKSTTKAVTKAATGEDMPVASADTTDVKKMPADSTKKAEQKDKDMLKMYVLNSSGDTIRYKHQKLSEGWNYVMWDMREKGILYPSRSEPVKDDDDPVGQQVLPGDYKIVGLYQGKKDSVNINVRFDPRLKLTPADMEAKREWISKLYTSITKVQKGFRALQDVRKDIRMIESMMTNAADSIQTKIKDRQKELTKKISELEERVMEAENVKGYTNAQNINDKISSAQAYLSTSPGKPGANAIAQMQLAENEVEKFTQEVNSFLEKDWNEFTLLVKSLEWPVFKSIEKVE